MSLTGGGGMRMRGQNAAIRTATQRHFNVGGSLNGTAMMTAGASTFVRRMIDSGEIAEAAESAAIALSEPARLKEWIDSRSEQQLWGLFFAAIPYAAAWLADPKLMACAHITVMPFLGLILRAIQQRRDS